jgi:hypothetical protein
VFDVQRISVLLLGVVAIGLQGWKSSRKHVYSYDVKMADRQRRAEEGNNLAAPGPSDCSRDHVNYSLRPLRLAPRYPVDFKSVIISCR